MRIEVITATIAAFVAVVSAAISIYGQQRVVRLNSKLAEQREVKALISKYKNPLLRSAIDLQSRLYNIHQQNFLSYSYNKSKTVKEYAIANTLFVIAEYLGWVEILRREIQFLELGDLEQNRQLTERLVAVNQAFAKSKTESKVGNLFVIYNGEQRAIGEIVTIARHGSTSVGYDCIGYATFVSNMSNPDFSTWFTKLMNDIEVIANEPGANVGRVALIHSKLIDLIDFLDPQCITLPPNYRTRIK